jgi:hypothetical protein
MKTLIPVTDFIEFALSHANPKTVPIGAKLIAPAGTAGIWRYVYGMHGQVITAAYLDRAFKHYQKEGWTREEFDSYTNQYKDGERGTDCNGLLDAFRGVDQSADHSFRKLCSKENRGEVGALCNRPFRIGEAVFMGTARKKTHIGFICGFMANGEPLVVEARGIAFDTCVTRINKRRMWKYRGLLDQLFEYGPADETLPYTFQRLLKKGCKGDDVVELKKLLIQAGYADGITTNTPTSKNYGSNTVKMVKALQSDAGITVDGIAGPQTITTLGGVYHD